MNFTQIKETCLYVNDLDLAEEFYHLKLGTLMISNLRKIGCYAFNEWGVAPKSS